MAATSFPLTAGLNTISTPLVRITPQPALRHLSRPRRQQYIEQLRSEVRILKRHRDDTREGIESAIDMLNRSLDHLHAEGRDQAEDQIDCAVKTLMLLLAEDSRLSGTNDGSY